MYSTQNLRLKSSSCRSTCPRKLLEHQPLRLLRTRPVFSPSHRTLQLKQSTQAAQHCLLYLSLSSSENCSLQPGSRSAAQLVCVGCSQPSSPFASNPDPALPRNLLMQAARNRLFFVLHRLRNQHRHGPQPHGNTIWRRAGAQYPQDRTRQHQVRATCWVGDAGLMCILSDELEPVTPKTGRGRIRCVQFVWWEKRIRRNRCSRHLQ